jgi:hypothetical protein
MSKPSVIAMTHDHCSDGSNYAHCYSKMGRTTTKSESRPLVDFDVLNNNLIKGLISCVKYIRKF